MSERAGKRAGIRDVADAVGVSISTVSRALRGYADVNSGTRERVRAAAVKLGYTPDAAGQALKSGRTETVAVLVSGSHGPTFLDAFYAEVGGARGPPERERLKFVADAFGQRGGGALAGAKVAGPV